MPEETLNKEIEIVTTFLKNNKEGTYRLAEYIVAKYNIVTIGEKEREIYVYEDGIYHRAENNIIFPEIQRILLHHVNKNAKTETLHKIADMTSFSRNIFTTTDPRYIPLANGVYDLKTALLLPHSPEYRFTYKFPITYLPKAISSGTEAFLDQVLSPEQRLIVEEWIGYYFYRNYQFKKAIIFVGEGDTGKTTLLEVITHLIGADNISSVSLHKMSADRFSAAQLFEKHANIVDELSAEDIADTGAFKMATGGGSIMGEHKFGNQFLFKNYAKFTFACNKIPEVKDRDDNAYYNRWMVIRFENTIENKISNFIETLTTDEERSGLFNLAIKGLERLLKQGRFTYNNSADETKTEMMRSGSSISVFTMEMLEREDDAEITKEDLYDAYAKYCRKSNLSTQTKEMFGRRIQGAVPYIADGKVIITKDNGKSGQARGWRNVKIKGITPPKKDEEVDWGDFKENDNYSTN